MLTYCVTSIYYIFVTTVCLLPDRGGGSPPFPHFDKVAHFGLHFLGALLLRKSGFSYKKIFIGDFLFGLTIECIQLGVPGRSFELLDLLANSLGVLFALSGARYLSNKKDQIPQ